MPEKKPLQSWNSIEEYYASQAGGLTLDEMRQLGIDVMDECRNVLMLRFRYLNVALWHMPFEVEREMHSLMTDGKTLYFGPMATAARFRKQSDEVIRDLLHLILHCLFRHPFDNREENGDIFGIACDIMVEALAMELCQREFSSALDAQRAELVESLRKLYPSLAPHKVYRYLYDNIDDEGLLELQRIFSRDSHAMWACMKIREDSLPASGNRPDTERDRGQAIETGEGMRGYEGDPGQGDSDNPDDQQQNGDGDTSQYPQELDMLINDDEASSDELEDEDERERSEEDEEAEAAWEEIAKQVEVDAATQLKMQGEGAGMLEQLLAVANRKHYDYATFLRKFAVMGEDLRLSNDEFDYVYYTFGLDMYGNSPLIEPLEYRETNRVREFAIAIDTSGSCAGELVKTFIQRTYDILRQSEQFGDKVNVHIIQCDAAIQDDTKITSLREMKDFLDTFEVRGFGGTDFQPVFAYVDKLIQDDEFEDLRGLIYFTDGLGTFPKERPAYDTAFVFVNDELSNLRVPPWSMKVILDEESVRRL